MTSENRAEKCQPIIEAHHISKIYSPQRLNRYKQSDAENLDNLALDSEPRTQGLLPLSLDIYSGATVAIIGESGSGKTTLLRLLLGIIQPDTGEILFHGNNCADPKTQRELRAKSGVVLQNPARSFDPRWTIKRSVAEPLTTRHYATMSDNEREIAVNNSFESVGLDGEKCGNLYPSQLSGGQIQRAAFARAIINKPTIFAADEAMSAVDMPTRLMMIETLRRVQSENSLMTTLIASHDLGIVHKIADTIIVVHHGRIVEQGPTNQILNHPSQDYTKRLIIAASW